MITKVSLNNWKCHLDSELEFSEGTNCLVGVIGAGKTSILDAICFALFGTFPQLQQKKIRLKDVIMKKPKQQQKAEVLVNFEIENDEYTVIRRIEKGKTSAELRKNSALIEVQPRRVTEAIEKILKVDYDLFTRAVYSEQNALDMFLTIPKGQRMKKIDELLRLDKFELARASVVALTNRFETSKLEKEKLMEAMQQDENIKNFSKIKEELKRAEKEKTVLENELEIIKKQRARKREEFEKLQTLEKKITSISEEINSISLVNQQVKNDLEEIKISLKGIKLSYLEKKFNEISEFIKKTEEDLEQENKELDILKQKFAEEFARKKVLEQELSESERVIKNKAALKKKIGKKSIKKILLTVEEKKKKYDAEKSFSKMLEMKIFQLKKDIKEIRSADRCPTCYRNLSEEKKNELIKKKLGEIKKFEMQLKKHEKLLSRLIKKIEELENEIEELKEIENQLKKIEELEAGAKKAKKEIIELERKMNLDEKEIRMSEKNLRLLRQNLDKKRIEREELKHLLAKKQEFEKKQMILDSNEKKIKRLKKEKTLLEKDFSEKAFVKLSKELEELLGKEKGIEAKLSGMKIIIDERQKRIQDIERKIELLEKYKGEIRKSEAIIEQLELLEKALMITQEQLRKNFVMAINYTMHLIWQELYPYGDFSSIRLATEGDYILQLQDSTGWVSADSVSGGERSLACLTLRIAFALVLAPQLRWLVLDEPTHNLDAKAIEELARVLRDRITEFVEQVFLITHDPALENAVSGFLYRLERNKEKDGFTKIVKLGD